MDDIILELDILRRENARLKELLHRHGIAYEATSSPVIHVKKPMIPQLSLEEKVTLFRSLFRGREDVFTRLVYSNKFPPCKSRQSLEANGRIQESGVLPKSRYAIADIKFATYYIMR